MTREEAIEIIRDARCTSPLRDALETLIPELRESEDERIRKDMIEYFTEIIDNICVEEDIKHGEKVFVGRLRKFLAYLEKQKALSELGKYIAAERTKPGFMFAGNDSVSWEELPLDVRKHDYPYYFIGDLDCYPFDAEKQKEQDSENEKCTDFTIYHPLKNGKGEADKAKKVLHRLSRIVNAYKRPKRRIMKDFDGQVREWEIWP